MGIYCATMIKVEETDPVGGKNSIISFTVLMSYPAVYLRVHCVLKGKSFT